MCPPSNPFVFVVRGMFYGKMGLYYLANVYCSKFQTSELTEFITITYHNSDVRIKLNEEHG